MRDEIATIEAPDRVLKEVKSAVLELTDDDAELESAWRFMTILGAIYLEPIGEQEIEAIRMEARRQARSLRALFHKLEDIAQMGAPRHE